MTSVAVLIPVLARPHRVGPLLASLKASAEPSPKLVPVFLCSPGDAEQIAEVHHEGCYPFIMDWPAGHGDYARKMNHGYEFAIEQGHEWILLGADDLHFHPGWARAALAVAHSTRACVIGTNDLGNPRVQSGRHSTHTLVHRDYRECGTIDDASLLLHPGYDHQFVDDEFVQTAMYRRTWAFAPHAILEHQHPNWGKAETDATYEKGQARFAEDSDLYRTRSHLWGR